jgi:hypothetical protein
MAAQRAMSDAGEVSTGIAIPPSIAGFSSTSPSRLHRCDRGRIGAATCQVHASPALIVGTNAVLQFNE